MKYRIQASAQILVLIQAPLATIQSEEAQGPDYVEWKEAVIQGFLSHGLCFAGRKYCSVFCLGSMRSGV